MRLRWSGYAGCLNAQPAPRRLWMKCAPASCRRRRSRATRLSTVSTGRHTPGVPRRIVIMRSTPLNLTAQPKRTRRDFGQRRTSHSRRYPKLRISRAPPSPPPAPSAACASLMPTPSSCRSSGRGLLDAARTRWQCRHDDEGKVQALTCVSGVCLGGCPVADDVRFPDACRTVDTCPSDPPCSR
ncbi:MAG: hypothetical protein QOD83_429 [Solirubrobacteraceae bacterium]|nr:hypothetical protein [Solirubrobacteraceae bacterium]